ncbi:Core atranone cluster (CAC) protein, partial [Lachnellula suecica]
IMSASSAATEPSRIRKTALAAVESYSDWNITSVMSYRSAKCSHEVLPKSLGRPPLNNEEYARHFASMLPWFRNFKVTINDTFVDEKANKVVFWAQSTAETDIGPYTNEYMLVLYLNEEGDKVDRFLEFVDVGVSMGFLPKLNKYIEKELGAQNKIKL